MSLRWHTRWAVFAAAVAGWAWLGAPAPARAQFNPFGLSQPGSRYELSETVQLDQADNTVKAHLERVKQCLAAKQWDEAVETLRQVMEQSGGKLLGVTPRRYVSVRDYCQLQLVSLPPEALALYRSLVDPMAQKWYEEGVARRDPQRLLDVVDHALAGSWGDNALMALGEMALESGDYAAARAYWEKIIPVEQPATGPRTWLSAPNTDLDLAAVRARLVLVSILEGSRQRAGEELAQFVRLHPQAKGRMGGREVEYAAFLKGLLEESTAWPKRPAGPDWLTFAGSPTRNKTAAVAPDLGEVAWRLSLPPTPPAQRSVFGGPAAPRRVAEMADAPLGYHPVVAGGLVLVNNQTEILAVDLQTGQPAWGSRDAVIFQDPLEERARELYNPPNLLGVPRFTLTVCQGKLYARMGSAVTSTPLEPSLTAKGGYLVCLDLENQGRLLWRIEPDEKGWAFDGSPVADGTNVYVAMRRSDVQPQAHVACFDAETGQLRWRRFVCASETPARGMLYEATHNLLTLYRETLYFNTNQGAVAALSARDGRILWVSLYPRTASGDLENPDPHTCRDLTPCLFDRGTLLVAPADSRRIFALEAATGQILWETGPEVEDVIHLLGVAGDTLIASGERLYWIELKGERPGRVAHVWPDGSEKLGYGRGILAGGSVYWPTREKIYVFDQATAQLKKSFDLAPRGCSGGNLLVAGGRMLIAGADGLVALSQNARPPQAPQGNLTGAW